MTYFENIIKLVKSNDNFRDVIVTGENMQVVLMCLLPGEEIGEEEHEVEQTLIFVEGEGEAVVGGLKYPIGEGDLFFVPARTKHNFINTGITKMRLYTIYAPPEHKPHTVHETKEQAEEPAL